MAYSACIAFGGLATLIYGVIFGPPFAGRDPLVKATATIGFLLILVGVMQYVWPPLDDPHVHPADVEVELRPRRTCG